MVFRSTDAGGKACAADEQTNETVLLEIDVMK